MQFTLTGFTQDIGFRVFAYDGVGADKIRIKFTVRADLALSRRYGIRLQELPLMCLEILERRDVENPERYSTDETRALTFDESQMCNYAQECTAARDAAALRKKTPRKQPAKTPEESNPYNQMAPEMAKPAFGRNW